MRIIPGIICALLLCSTGLAGEPPILDASLQTDRIAVELLQQESTREQSLAESIREMQNQMQLLTDEMARLSRSQKVLREECAMRIAKLENRAWAAENPGVTYPGQPARTQASTTNDGFLRNLHRLVDQYRGNHDGSRNSAGAYLIREYSNGMKTRALIRETTQPVRRPAPVVRSAAISRPVQRAAPISYGSSYMQPSNMGWGSSFFGGGAMMGGAACVGGS